MASLTVPLQSVSSSTPVVRECIPWYLWSLVAAVILVTVGGQVDVSWHRTIGRDSFWTAPHIMVYCCGVLAGISCAWTILVATFSQRAALRDHSVSLFGLRAPIGILLTAWGGLTMLYSAPVDNWWHNAYGLDVRVASPPHILLLAGTIGVVMGTLLVAVAHLNRASLEVAEARASCDPALPYQRLFLFAGALAVIHLMSYSMGYTFDTRLHQAKAYIVMSIGVPFTLSALAVASRRRWTATIVAGIYTVFMLALVWGLPLIPASPRIGPVFQNVTHMVPPKFPILLLVPSFVLDILWTKAHQLNRSLAAALSGLAWVTCLVAAEWPFATFLMSPAADNRFFASRVLDFGTPANNADALRIFENPQHYAHLAAGLLLAVVVAGLGIRLGRSCGEWMRHIYR